MNDLLVISTEKLEIKDDNIKYELQKIYKFVQKLQTGNEILLALVTKNIADNQKEFGEYKNLHKDDPDYRFYLDKRTEQEFNFVELRIQKSASQIITKSFDKKLGYSRLYCYFYTSLISTFKVYKAIFEFQKVGPL